MPDKQLTIRVVTTGDASGALKVRDAIRQTTQATTEAGPAAGGLAEQLDEQGKAADKATFSHRELHKITHKLGEAFPEAGALVRALTNPLLFAAITAIGVFSHVKEQIAELDKELEESGKRAAEPTFAEAIKAKAEALRKFQTDAAVFGDSLKHLFDPETQYHDKIKETIDLLHEQYAAMALIADAQKGLALERVNANEKTGRITPETAAVQRAQIEADARRRAAERAKGESADVLGIKRTELETTAKAGPALAAQKEEAEAAAKATEAARVESESQLRRAEAERDRLNQAAKDASELAEAAAKGESHKGLPTFAWDPAAMRKEFADKAAAAQLEADKNERQLKTLPGRLGEDITAAKRASEDLVRTQDAVRANEQHRHDLEKEVALLEKKKALTDATQATVGGLVNQTEASKSIAAIGAAGPAGALAVHAEDQALEATRQARLRGIQSLSQEQVDLLEEVGKDITGHVVTAGQTIRLLSSHIDDFSKQQEDVVRILGKVTSRMGDHGQRLEALESAVDAMRGRTSANSTLGPG